MPTTKKNTTQKETKKTDVSIEDLEKRLIACEEQIASLAVEIKHIRSIIEKKSTKEPKKDKEPKKEPKKEKEPKKDKEPKEEPKEFDITKAKKQELLDKLKEHGTDEADVKKMLVGDLRKLLAKEIENSKGIKEKPKDKVEVTAHPDKGYSVDNHEFVYELSDETKAIARLKKDKPSPLTKKDIEELDTLNIEYEQLKAPELKKRLVPVKKEEPKKKVQKEKEPTEESSSKESTGKTDKSYADKSAEGVESSSTTVAMSTAEEGADIAANFESPPSPTEEDFRKFVNAAIRDKTIGIDDDIEEVSSKIGIPKNIVGMIQTHYVKYGKKWPDIITEAKKVVTEGKPNKPRVLPKKDKK